MCTIFNESVSNTYIFIEDARLLLMNVDENNSRKFIAIDDWSSSLSFQQCHIGRSEKPINIFLPGIVSRQCCCWYIQTNMTEITTKWRHRMNCSLPSCVRVCVCVFWFIENNNGHGRLTWTIVEIGFFSVSASKKHFTINAGRHTFPMIWKEGGEKSCVYNEQRWGCNIPSYFQWISLEIWFPEVLKLVNCKVLKCARSSTTDSYALNESNMLVFQSYLVLKSSRVVENFFDQNCGKNRILVSNIK